MTSFVNVTGWNRVQYKMARLRLLQNQRVAFLPLHQPAHVCNVKTIHWSTQHKILAALWCNSVTHMSTSKQTWISNTLKGLTGVFINDITQKEEEVRHFVPTGHNAYGLSAWRRTEGGLKNCPNLNDVIYECSLGYTQIKRTQK